MDLSFPKFPIIFSHSLMIDRANAGESFCLSVGKKISAYPVVNSFYKSYCSIDYPEIL